MLASDEDIERYIADGALRVDPYEPELLQPASLDLRLDRRFATFGPMPVVGAEWLTDPLPAIDPSQNQDRAMIPVDVNDGQSFMLPSLSFVLAATMESITLSPQLAGVVEGKSSLGRLGLMVHITAGFIDPGFSGTITLELFNAAPYPIRLWPGMAVAQLAVFRLVRPARVPYGSAGLRSHYQNQPRGPQVSQAWRNFRTWPTAQPEEIPDAA